MPAIARVAIVVVRAPQVLAGTARQVHRDAERLLPPSLQDVECIVAGRQPPTPLSPPAGAGNR